MKAALLRRVGGGFEPSDVTIDRPRGREVLVDVRASGLCHTDLTMSSLELGLSMPALFGHEVAGVVLETGPDVLDLKPGDHVVACLLHFCGRCSRCLSGQTSLCLDGAKNHRTADQPARLTADGEDVYQAFGLGGFAERALIHENQLVVVSKDIPFPQAALLGCGGVTGMGAVLNVADVQVGQSVVVIGAGGVGLNAISGARLAGAGNIIAVDVSAGSLDRARSFGATHVVDSSRIDALDGVRAILPHGADAVFDFVGAPAVTEQGYAMTTRGGGLYIIGARDPYATFSLSYASMVVGQTRVQGIDMGATTTRRDIPRYADLYLQGRLELDALVSKQIRWDQVDEGYEALKTGGLARVVITDFS